MDRCEPRVAGAGTVAPLVFEMTEEPADSGRVEIADVQARRCRPGVLVKVGEQEPERVAVGGDCVRAGVALSDEPVGEERLQQWSERGHVRASRVVCCAMLSMRAAWASSSGTAVRYQ